MPDCPPALPWLNADQLADASGSLRDWLFDTGSLTRRLTQLAGGAFDVVPLQEGWQSLRDDECIALGCETAGTGWSREVLLRGNEEPWVFARSVASRAALSSSGFDLETLGTRSLGELLFSDAAFQRGPLQAMRCPPNWLPPAHAEEGLWARRSCFRRGALGILVMEVFLPALMQAAIENPHRQ